MSRFRDFNDFLDNQQELRNYEISSRGQKIQQARKKYDRVIKDSFNVLRDYYDEVIKVRNEMHLILKKDEDIKDKLQSQQIDKPFYTYLVNFVPKDLLPLAFEPSYSYDGDYLSLGKTTSSDWYLKVALQFEVSLFEIIENKKEFTGNLMPHIYIRVWGKLREESKNIIGYNIGISYHKAWRHIYLQLALKNDAISTVEKEIERLLMVVTPNVLCHKKEVFNLD